MASMCIGFVSCREGNGGNTMKIEYIEDILPEDYYRDGCTNNYIVGIDQFGRTFEASSGDKTDKDRNVGIFYFLCNGQHGGDKIRDVTEILSRENGKELMFYTDNEECPEGRAYYWGQPLYGYYNSADSWVMRRHLALLYSAGVDFLVFDCTNGPTYDSVVTKLIKEAKTMAEEGFDVPKFAYYTNAGSVDVITGLYNKFYRTGKNDSVWYKIDGKPLIIAPVEDMWKLSPEIRDYFYFREKQWPSDAFQENGFPWMEWSYPSPVHNDVINVAVAAHPALPMSFSVTRGAKNWGRGWNVEKNINEPDKAETGQFFQSEWNTALKEDPGTVFVTGWNEWTAGKMFYEGEYAMVDLCNFEFSRDAEIMKGGANDAFFIQLCQNIRRYKSSTLAPGMQFRSEPLTISMTDDLSQWNSVKAVFKEYISVNKERSIGGAAPDVRYEQAEARNFLKEVRIAGDAENFYFYIRTENSITERASGDSTFMNLFIGTGAVGVKGWESYEYVIGREENGDGTVSVEKLNSDYTGVNKGSAAYRIDGNVMQICVPKTVLGIASDVNSLYFKVADGIENPSDIMEYYVSGMSLPLGRLSARYLG